MDGLNREESCGAHFREESQTETGEAKRKDKEYSYVFCLGNIQVMAKSLFYIKNLLCLRMLNSKREVINSICLICKKQKG